MFIESYRPLLTTYAYNILGSFEDARDVVQDAYVKFMGVDVDRIENQKAYLVRTVINLAINQKKRQRKLIDSYPGEWLPEPVATELADTALNRKEVLSYSLMVLLEKLNPKQRAVFILKEAFDYDHEEIAQALEITAENSRKLLSRARQQLKDPLPAADSTIAKNYIGKYLEVIRQGDTGTLEKLLHNEIVLIADGGGKATASKKPLEGIKRVMAFVVGISNKFYKTTRIELREVNHTPALYYYTPDNQIETCQVFIVQNGVITNAYFIRNPDKLRNLENSTADLSHS